MVLRPPPGGKTKPAHPWSSSQKKLNGSKNAPEGLLQAFINTQAYHLLGKAVESRVLP